MLFRSGMDYVSQILAEQKQLDERGREVWENVHNRPNHLFDAELLAAACVEMEFPGGGLRVLAGNLRKQQRERARQGDDEVVRHGADRLQPSKRSGWLQR